MITQFNPTHRTVGGQLPDGGQPCYVSTDPVSSGRKGYSSCSTHSQTVGRTNCQCLRRSGGSAVEPIVAGNWRTGTTKVIETSF